MTNPFEDAAADDTQHEDDSVDQFLTDNPSVDDDSDYDQSNNPVPQDDATVDGVNRVVDLVEKHHEPGKDYPNPVTRSKDDDPMPEDGAELTEWIARKNPTYAVQPDKQDVAEAYLAKRLGLVDTEQEYLDKVVGTSRTEPSVL